MVRGRLKCGEITTVGNKANQSQLEKDIETIIKTIEVTNTANETTCTTTSIRLA
jgi:hypothetical protein